MLYQFMRRAHHYLERLPREDARIEWLALMQHHGAPTRLLDFTYSFYIACHFAFSQPETNVSIWAINLARLEERLAEKMGVDSRNWRIDEYRRQSLLEADKAIKDNSQKSGLYLVEPDTLNPRESIQQGVFIMPETLSKSFLENLTTELNIPPKSIDEEPEKKGGPGFNTTATGWDLNSVSLIEFRMSRKLKHVVWTELERMNIDEATLFPGLDGYARSLHRHIKAVSPHEK